MVFAVDILARTALLPVLIWQAIGCYRKARILPAPPGPRSGVAGQGPDLRVLIVGDSSALGVGTRHQSEGLSGQLAKRLASDYRVHWDTIGWIGADTGDTLKRLGQIEDGNYDVVVTCLGVNDVTHRIPLRRWMRQTDSLIKTLDAKFAPRKIIVSLIPPLHHFPLLPNPLRWVLGRQALRFNRAMRLMARQWPQVSLIGNGIALVPEVMSIDGFHLGPPVYAEWANQAVLALHDKPTSAVPLGIDPQEASA
jgi:lysophospholipase L1-like esterase